jgi:thymidylate synthase (FAD)
MKVELVAITQCLIPERPTPEQLIEYAGRVCWRTDLAPDDSGCQRFIDALMKKAHLSVIEHASASFEISGVSRACSHQLVRHRLASYSQESQRYVDGSDFEFVTPPMVGKRAPAQRVYAQFMRMAQDAYTTLRGMGVHKEDARFVLPNATVTRLVMTQNFRSWLHFCEVRCHPSAQWEIRAVATEILRQLNEQAPSVFGELWHSV